MSESGPFVAEPGRVSSARVTGERPEHLSWYEVQMAERWPHKVHYVKVIPPYFEHVNSGAKGFEVRRDDRGYQPGDLLVLSEWDPYAGAYAEADCLRRIDYVLRDGQEFGVKPGFVVLSLSVVHLSDMPPTAHARTPSAKPGSPS